MAEIGAVSNTKNLFDAVRATRNTLMHGGKYLQGQSTDSARDNHLLEDAIKIIETVLKFDANIKHTFYEGDYEILQKAHKNR